MRHKNKPLRLKKEKERNNLIAFDAPRGNGLPAFLGLYQDYQNYRRSSLTPEQLEIIDCYTRKIQRTFEYLR